MREDEDVEPDSDTEERPWWIDYRQMRHDVRALIRKLPVCRCGHAGTQQDNGGDGPYCDAEVQDHNPAYDDPDNPAVFYDLPYAAELRKVMVFLGRRSRSPRRSTHRSTDTGTGS